VCRSDVVGCFELMVFGSHWFRILGRFWLGMGAFCFRSDVQQDAWFDSLSEVESDALFSGLCSFLIRRRFEGFSF